jgi:hypothetical protein
MLVWELVGFFLAILIIKNANKGITPKKQPMLANSGYRKRPYPPLKIDQAHTLPSERITYW